jgi:small GTP-binding protein
MRGREQRGQGAILAPMDFNLSEPTRELLGRERSVVADLRSLLDRVEAERSDIEDLKTALKDLEGIFMLVVSGEYNSGKSTFLNALLGVDVLPEGVTPTTDKIYILRYGDFPHDVAESDFILRREYPHELLRNMALVDTPGTNAILTHHQEMTERFIPRADLVLFVTSADRPFTESERRFLELISSWGKKIVIVVNKLDILEREEERDEVLRYVREQSRRHLDLTPQVFGVYAKQALRAKRSRDEGMLEKTGLPELERFILGHLAEGERLRLKMMNPLGVARQLARKYRGLVEAQLELLEDDRRTLEEVDRQLVQHRKDMEREFESYLARIKTVLLEVERRGDKFFDDTVRLSRMFHLMRSERVREEFNVRVIRGADRDMELALAALVDWLIDRNLQIWEDVMAFVNERRKAGEERVIGEIGGRFNYDRDTLIRNLRYSAEEVLKSYDEERESERLAETLQTAVVQSGLLQVGGIGLGAAFVAFVSGLALDITGIMAGLTLAGIGLLVLPHRRNQAKKELHVRMQDLRDRLDETLREAYEHEIGRSMDRLNAAITPYTRFVKSELERLEGLLEEFDRANESLQALRVEVEALA